MSFAEIIAAPIAFIWAAVGVILMLYWPFILALYLLFRFVRHYIRLRRRTPPGPSQSP
jgi:hypothetical protein